VKYWVTFDEANDWAGLGYSTNQNPPGRCTANIIGQMNMNYGACADGDSATEPYIVGHNLLLAHAEAVSIYRSKYQVRTRAKKPLKRSPSKLSRP
jgi:beta-glucosidase